MNNENGKGIMPNLPKLDPQVVQVVEDANTNSVQLTGNPVQDGMSDVPLDIRSFHFMKTSVKR